MCEILGLSFEKETTINDYLKIFYSHSNNHPHGWGLAVVDKNNINIEKEPIKASKSSYLKEKLSEPIITKTALAHIRYATIGNIDYKNCHPYSITDNCDRRWTLIHNGTIFEYKPLCKFLKLQNGETDSERILMYMIEQINKKQKEKGKILNAEERFTLLDSVICDMSKGNKLNLLFFDGEYIYAHTNYADSLHYLETESGVVFSTLPLTNDEWKNLPMTTLFAYKNGKLKFSGTNHRQEYFDNEESLKYLYQIFSDL